MTRIWWSRSGAEQGEPWNVQWPCGRVMRYASVEFTGESRTVFRSEGFELPDGPRGVIEVVDGKLAVKTKAESEAPA